jgi:hypothetical protein
MLDGKKSSPTSPFPKFTFEFDITGSKPNNRVERRRKFVDMIMRNSTWQGRYQVPAVMHVQAQLRVRQGLSYVGYAQRSRS